MSDKAAPETGAKELPGSAQVVIIGGGVIGCSVAYHLTKLGISDVVLLERRQLTCGTTWHAAGLVGQLRGSQRMTQLAKYTAELYHGLEAETGQATGFKQTGSISIATNEARFEELKRNASMAKIFDLQVDVITPEEVKERYPLVNTEDVLGAVHIPSDGKANPVDVTQALAKGARTGGALIREDCKVLAIRHDGERVTGVETDAGEITADAVVLCAGMWTRDLAASIGVNVPLHACEHFYIMTEAFDGVTPDLPVLRDYDACAYYKEDAGKILLGAFEPNAKPWGMDGIPEDFSFDELPEDFDHFEPILTQAMHRMPALADVGIQTFFCGPESFTPDVRYQLGEVPELANCFVAAGFNSIGIQSAGGIGQVLAEWIRDGRPPPDLWEVDIRRNLPFQGNKKYLRERVSETLGLLYAMHWPFHQAETGRGVRRSPVHDRLVARGACHGVAFGWERPNWFAPEGTEARYQYNYGRQNWFDPSAEEHRAVRGAVGLLDQCSFAKFRLQGRDAWRILGQVAANHVDVAPGKVIYTQWLNEQGGIEADLTVTRLADDDFLIVTSGEFQVRDFHWLKRRIPKDAHAVLTDVTSGLSMLGLMGPRARDLLQSLSPDDLSNDAFPFGTSREIELGFATVRASRISYVGELGWELYIPSEFTTGVWDVLVEAGESYGLRQVGMHAMNSLRIEKAYRHYGHDITDADTPLEGGLGFAVKFDKPGGFVGREALKRQKEAGLNKRLVQFLLGDPDPMLYHNEPIWRDGNLAGYVRSAMYGHTLGAAVALGYVENPDGVDAEYVNSGTYEIEIAGVRYPATASLRPLYDPKSERIKA
ncbi:MAG: 4-methylaminobutanoate oxidase (formaldehyde-forming) [Alphaproteobacteria bacterium MarineAlpha10_Bin2]|nr:MAG: 4-methylaminobutanoate oxidase (formaldehyde-forming) [Alphaproteobacteria bacterium MarineAlpha10_Bin2]